MRFAFVRESEGTWPVAALCRNLGVTPAGYYAWRGRPPSERAKAEAALAAEAGAAFAEAKGRYGSPRLRRALLARGVACRVNTVAEATRALGLAACRPRRRRPPGPGGAEGDATPNTLGRQFAATRPDEKWVSDITFIATGEGWLYLAAVEDLYSRRIVGWAMGDAPDSALVGRALAMAVTGRRPAAGLLVHSDRGCQYTSAEYRSAARGHGAVLSFSRKGNCSLQRAGGELLRQPQEGTRVPRVVRHAGVGRAGCVRVRRGFLQPGAPALVAGVRRPRDLRVPTNLTHRQQTVGKSIEHPAERD